MAEEPQDSAKKPRKKKAKPPRAAPTPLKEYVVPGSYFVRPSRSEAEVGELAFYDLFLAVRNPKHLALKKLADVLADDTLSPESNISRAITDGRISDKDRKLILDYIFDEQSVITGEARDAVNAIPDALYFAFLEYFDAKETSQDSARARIVGTYKLWRFSVEHDGEFVFGKLHFGEDPITRAVRVEMTQKRKPRDGYRALTERFTGYLFRVSHMYMMVLRDERTNDCRITVFPRAKMDYVGVDINPRSVFQGSRLHIVQMDGFGLGIDGSSGFFSPVHISLVDDADELARLNEMLDVAKEGEPIIPARVVTKLRQNGPLRRL